MRFTRRTALVALAIAGVSGGVLAGNGSGPEPTGTIYFHDLSTLDASTNTVTLFSMDGNGGSVTEVIRTDRHVRPNHRLREGDRWFLTMRAVEGEEVGGEPRRDVFAVRADGGYARLTSDPTVEYWMPEWVPSESDRFAVVSMLGRRWTSAAADATPVPGRTGLYLLRVEFEGRDVSGFRGTFDSSGNSAESSVHPTLVCNFYDSSVEDRESVEYFASLPGTSPDVAAYSWSGDSNFLAVQDLHPVTPRIRVVDLTGDVGLHARWEGRDPDWSHAANTYRVAFSRLIRDAAGTDTWVVETAEGFGGVGRFTEVSVPRPAEANATRSLATPKYAPDDNYIAYQLLREGLGTTYSIHRAGGLPSALNLTPNVKRAAAGSTGAALIAWR